MSRLHELIRSQRMRKARSSRLIPAKFIKILKPLNENSSRSNNSANSLKRLNFSLMFTALCPPKSALHNNKELVIIKQHIIVRKHVAAGGGGRRDYGTKDNSAGIKLVWCGEALRNEVNILGGNVYEQEDNN